jgi:hypothetical protein
MDIKGIDKLAALIPHAMTQCASNINSGRWQLPIFNYQYDILQSELSSAG